MPKPAPYVLIMHWFFIPCPRPTACKSTTFPQTPPQNPVNSFFFPVVPVIRITLEEIVVQQVADFEEQVGVDPAAVEDLVGVLAGEAELAGEPGDGAPLPVEFLLDEIADVRFFVHCVCLWWSLARWANKMGGTILDAYLKPKARQSL